MFEILMKVQLGKPWQETLLEVLPMRKGAKPKEDAIVGKTKTSDESEVAELKELKEATDEETNNNGNEATS